MSMENLSYGPKKPLSPTVAEHKEYDVRSYLDELPVNSFRSEKIREWVNLLETIALPEGFSLGTITANTQNGISVYGFITDQRTSRKYKIRISNHKAKGNSAHPDLDLRNPQDSTTLVDFLKTRSLNS